MTRRYEIGTLRRGSTLRRRCLWESTMLTWICRKLSWPLRTWKTWSSGIWVQVKRRLFTRYQTHIAMRSLVPDFQPMRDMWSLLVKIISLRYGMCVHGSQCLSQALKMRCIRAPTVSRRQSFASHLTVSLSWWVRKMAPSLSLTSRLATLWRSQRSTMMSISMLLWVQTGPLASLALPVSTSQEPCICGLLEQA